MTLLFKTALTTLAAGSMLALALFPTAPAFALDDKQKQEMGAFIREYLLQNPEIMLEVQDALQAKQVKLRGEMAEKGIADNKEAIFSSPHDITLGNPKGDVTVVEFFDYNCGYCKRALSDMDQMLEKDKNIRFILKEWPVLGPDSVAAHHVANAVRLVAPDKYLRFHRTLLGGQGHANAEVALAVADSLGISEAALRKSIREKPANDILEETTALAEQIGITGTPSYIVGDELVPGAQGIDVLEAKVANMRACGKASC